MSLPTRDCPAPSAPPLNPSTVPPQELVRSVSRQPLDRIFRCYSVSWPEFDAEYEKNTRLPIRGINWHLGKNIPVLLVVLHLMRSVTQQPLDRIITCYSVLWPEFDVEFEEIMRVSIWNEPKTLLFWISTFHHLNASFKVHKCLVNLGILVVGEFRDKYYH